MIPIPRDFRDFIALLNARRVRYWPLRNECRSLSCQAMNLEFLPEV
jgi:hypothetical protein